MDTVGSVNPGCTGCDLPPYRGPSIKASGTFSLEKEQNAVTLGSREKREIFSNTIGRQGQEKNFVRCTAGSLGSVGVLEHVLAVTAVDREVVSR